MRIDSFEDMYLAELQELLYAAQRQSVLVILQGRDTSGKDGTIRHVTGPLNSQSCTVSSFKVPTEEELAHGHVLPLLDAQ